MTTLWKITDDICALDETLDEMFLQDGDFSDEEGKVLGIWWEENQANLEEKANGYCHLIRNLEASVAIRKEEAQRLAKLAKYDENKAQRLKDALKEVMQTVEQPKLNTKHFKISVCKNGGRPKLSVTTDLLPDRLVRVIREPNLELIHEQVKVGSEVPGVEVKPRGTHLRVR